MSDEELISVNEAARLLNVSRDTIIRMVKDKQLDGFKVRGQWRVRKSSVDTYLKGQR